MRRSTLARGAVIGAASLFGFSTATQAALLYGWNGSNEGWTGERIVGTAPAGDRGVTEGTGAIMLLGPINTWDNANLFRSSADSGSILSALAGNTEISFDIVMLATGFTGHQNYSISLLISGKDADGNNFGWTAADFVPEKSTGTYANDHRVTSNQATLIFDYSAVAGGSLTAGTAQEVAFRITAGAAGGFSPVNDEQKTLVIDNLRVVPEPGSLSVLGLAGLALMRRRRGTVCVRMV